MVKMGSKVNIQGLRQLYDSEYEYVQAFFEYIAERTKNSKETTVDRVRRIIRRRGYECSRNDAVWLLKELEALGVGTFIVGRRGQKSRFQWEAEMISVGQVACGEEVEIEMLDPETAYSLEDEESDEEILPGFVRHEYNLRPDMAVRIDLPADITAVEARRLSGYVRTLSYEDA